MLVRRSFILRPNRVFSRHVSTTYPFQNIRAFPFRVSPEQAITHMAPYASILSMFKHFIGSLGARFLPGFGFEPIRPTRIVPIYFPAWVIDGELQASITYNDAQRTVLTQFINTYLPGNDFKVLSLMSFWYKQLQEYQLVPFTPELETQHGMQVQCLPYTISPFSPLDIAQKWPHGDVKVADDFQFSPTSIKPNLIAAYPVLIPLYLAQYNTDLPGMGMELNYTLFMEGFSNTGRIFAEKYSEQVGERLRELLPNAPSGFMRFTHVLDDITVQPLRGRFSRFTRIGKMGVPQAPNMHSVLRHWLDLKLCTSPTFASLLAEVSKDSPALRGEDERVRDFLNHGDRANTHMWLSLGTRLATTEMVLETMKSATLSRNVHIVGGKKGANPADVMDGTVKALEEVVSDAAQQREETLPTWWKEWKKREDGTTENGSPQITQSTQS
ncbi:hypothetical protein AX15_001960 [Amanita polypyramis BW_CC]|nr:hypothetical protein AX15_001960 [Amanita polypyramis BW_CC]